MRGDVAKGGMLPEDGAESLMTCLSDGGRIDFWRSNRLRHRQTSPALAGLIRERRNHL